MSARISPEARALAAVRDGRYTEASGILLDFSPDELATLATACEGLRGIADHIRRSVHRVCVCVGLSHRDDCPEWVLPL